MSMINFTHSLIWTSKNMKKKKSKEKKRQTIVKLLVHDSNKSDKSDEIHDESTE